MGSKPKKNSKPPSPKEAFLLQISNSKIPALIELAMVHVERRAFNAYFSNDEDATRWEKGIVKDYVITEHYNLSDDYSHICEVDLRDYGYAIDSTGPDEPLSRALNDSDRDLSYVIDRVDLRERSVSLRGSMRGEVAHLDHSGWQVILDISGVRDKDKKNLNIFQELILEAHALECQGNRKLALFTYFSALESLITTTLEAFAQSIPSELHYSLEHLSLDDKVRVAVRTQTTPPLELDKISMWSDLIDELSKFKGVRNNIAHARHQETITQKQVDGGFFCVCLLYAFFTKKMDNHNDIRKHFYPKNILPKDFGFLIDNC
jgi:hypothetical protein